MISNIIRTKKYMAENVLTYLLALMSSSSLPALNLTYTDRFFSMNMFTTRKDASRMKNTALPRTAEFNLRQV